MDIEALGRLLPQEAFVAQYPAFAPGFLRHLIAHDVGDFRKFCTVKIGGKRVVDPQAVAAWAARQNDEGGYD